MKSPIRIYCDLDGPLADFVRGLHSYYVHGINYEKWLDSQWKKGKWDPHGALGTTNDVMWAKIYRNPFSFYTDLSRTQDSPSLWEELNKIAITSVLTAFPYSKAVKGGVVEGKIAWCEKHLEKPFKAFGVCFDKSVYAHKNGILVDDSEKNIARWIEAGGQGILYPCYWNRLHEMRDRALTYTLDRVKACVDVLRQDEK